ncbi:lipocalin-like domain-containing protein [Pandoraea sp. NPDC087047]|uniref:lipocalin-like domain-containing protein n=1 Tax=Pandoraea sp. NPDC087047 TaxID=3364390 RepID=UPI00381DBAFE
MNIALYLKWAVSNTVNHALVRAGLVREPMAVKLPGNANVGVEAPVSILRDESPHDVPLEWWYYTGHLSGTDIFGIVHDYGYQMTFFRSGLGLFPISSAYVGNIAISDLNRSAHFSSSKITIQPDLLLPNGGYNINLLGWGMNAKYGNGQISGSFFVPQESGNSKKYDLILNLQAQNPAVLHGNQGVMPENAAGSLRYYSFTDLKTSGVIRDNGLVVPVVGVSWFDHEFGTPSGIATGWHWYAIELSDGTKYCISLLKDLDDRTTLAYGTYIKADGTYSEIDPQALGDSAAGPVWTSPRSGVTYPTAEIVTVPGGQLIVTSCIDDQEMTLFGSMFSKFMGIANLIDIHNIYYMESYSSVTGVINGAAVSGRAYMEIVPLSSLAKFSPHLPKKFSRH